MGQCQNYYYFFPNKSKQRKPVLVFSKQLKKCDNFTIIGRRKKRRTWNGIN